SARISTSAGNVNLRYNPCLEIRGQEHYEQDNLTATVALSIASARGDIGTNADYVWKLQATLGALGIRDDYVSELALALHEAPCDDKLHQRGASL
ncbi:gamma-glutamylcyclotransferase, partial [Escherichia coli]